jgi:hypothetical protein
LRDLATRTADARTAEEVGAAVARVLADHRADVPFALLYVLEDEGAAVRLLGASGATPHVPNGATPSDVRAVAAPWPPGERIDDEPVWETVDLAALLPDLPGGSFLESTARALPLRIRVSAPGASDAVLVAGVSPRRELDDDYLWGLKTRSHSGASPEGCDRHGASPRCLDRPHQDLWEIGCGKSVG